MSEVIHTLIVEPDQAGDRLDRYIARMVPSLSRSYAQALIHNQHILVNALAAKSSQPIRTGDRVTIKQPILEPFHLAPEPIPLTIIYEDHDVVVVDKPAGMVVHPAPGHPNGTLVNALLAHYPDMHLNGTLRPGIVHRLDQGTSGLLVVARHEQAFHALKEQQQAHTMHKAYHAVAIGPFRESSGTINAPIGRHPTDRKRQAVLPDGRVAITHYHVLESLGAYTLLRIILETGRTHQIRVHFAHCHRPLLGDPLYVPTKNRPSFGLARQFLHASTLGFSLPSSGHWQEFSSPLPHDLDTTLQKLRAAAGHPATF